MNTMAVLTPGPIESHLCSHGICRFLKQHKVKFVFALTCVGCVEPIYTSLRVTCRHTAALLFPVMKRWGLWYDVGQASSDSKKATGLE